MLKRLVLRGGIVIVGANQVGGDLDIVGGLNQAGSGRLPVGHLYIGRDKVVMFSRIVSGTAAGHEYAASGSK